MSLFSGSSLSLYDDNDGTQTEQDRAMGKVTLVVWTKVALAINGLRPKLTVLFARTIKQFSPLHPFVEKMHN